MWQDTARRGKGAEQAPRVVEKDIIPKVPYLLRSHINIWGTPCLRSRVVTIAGYCGTGKEKRLYAISPKDITSCFSFVIIWNYHHAHMFPFLETSLP